MSNKAIAEKVGCNATYVSQILSSKGRTGDTTTTTRKRRKPRATGAKIVTASKAATTTTTGTPDMAGILKARRDMACIVSRVGGCAAKALLDDVTDVA